MKIDLRGLPESCGGCLKQITGEKHSYFDKFDTPINNAAFKELGLPPITGVYVTLCKACFVKRQTIPS